jgi:hypothetical protein
MGDGNGARSDAKGNGDAGDADGSATAPRGAWKATEAREIIETMENLAPPSPTPPLP